MMGSFRIRYSADGGYTVSIPRYDGGLVVDGADYDAMFARAQRAEKALRLLCNELSKAIGIAGPKIRAAIGDINFSDLCDRFYEAELVSYPPASALGDGR